MNAVGPTPQSIAVAVRARLDSLGVPYIQQDVHEVLHEQAPGIVMSMAEPILIMLPPEEDGEDDDEAQDRFDAWMTAALDVLSTFLHGIFEQFGPVDETAFAATWTRSQTALLRRLQAISSVMPAGGCA